MTLLLPAAQYRNTMSNNLLLVASQFNAILFSSCRDWDPLSGDWEDDGVIKKFLRQEGDDRVRSK